VRRRSILTAGAIAVAVTVYVSTTHAAVLDLTTHDSWGTINNAIFQQYSAGPGGTGNIDSFLRIQGMGVQEGYNTDGTVEFDTMASFTHSIQLADIPIVTNGGGDYREFLLDINQNGQNILSVDEIRIALWDTGDLDGDDGGYSYIFDSPIYDLDAGEDNWIKLDYALNTGTGGSGAGDMLAYIPDSLFTGSETQYVYLYTKFGVNSVADDGFEEWAYGVDGPIIPEPATIALLGLGTLFVLRRKRR
jgi:hypothetical protein